MFQKSQSLSELLETLEGRNYNRHYKKIYLGRILNSANVLYALNEYVRSFNFQVEFSRDINAKYNAFIAFFEETEKLGHSIEGSLRLCKLKNNQEAELKEANAIKNKELGTEGKIYFEKEGQPFTEEDLKDGSIEWSLLHHFTKLPPEYLIKEYANWKANKRFHDFLKSEYFRLKMVALEQTELDKIETGILREAEASQTNNSHKFEKSVLNLSVDEFKIFTKDIVSEVVNENALHTQFNHPILESKTTELEHFTIAQLAEFLHCTKPSIHNYKKAGLPYFRIGRKVLFEKKKVMEFMKTIKSR